MKCDFYVPLMFSVMCGTLFDRIGYIAELESKFIIVTSACTVVDL